MTILERYMFRTAATAFLAVLTALTAVIWVTQALREVDLLATKGQTLLVFLLVTLLSIPTLLAIIAPIALFVAVIYALNKLSGDSELIVMSAAGLPPHRLMRPFAILGLLVAALVGWLTVVVVPDSFRSLRDVVTKVRADVITKVAREGQFTVLDSGVTFHYRERKGDALLGILLQDGRETERTTVYLAERGRTAEAGGGSFLVLEKGTVQRQQPDGRDPAVIVFERYAVDLAQLADAADQVVYKPRERSTTELLEPDTSSSYVQTQAGRFRAELHDRLSSPLFPMACAFAGFAALGSARTTRQNRGQAIAGAVLAVAALRVAIFGASSLTVRSPGAVALVYGLPLLACVGGLALAFRPDLGTALAGRLKALAGRRPRLARAG